MVHSTETKPISLKQRRPMSFQKRFQHSLSLVIHHRYTIKLTYKYVHFKSHFSATLPQRTSSICEQNHSHKSPDLSQSIIIIQKPKRLKRVTPLLNQLIIKQFFLVFFKFLRKGKRHRRGQKCQPISLTLEYFDFSKI